MAVATPRTATPRWDHGDLPRCATPRLTTARLGTPRHTTPHARTHPQHAYTGSSSGGDRHEEDDAESLDEIDLFEGGGERGGSVSAKRVVSPIDPKRQKASAAVLVRACVRIFGWMGGRGED